MKNPASTASADLMRFLARLPQIQDEAMRLGLVKTARALHTAVRESGWEAAVLREKEQSAFAAKDETS